MCVRLKLLERHGLVLQLPAPASCFAQLSCADEASGGSQEASAAGSGQAESLCSQRTV